MANLVGEIADAFLNYSIGSHRLRLLFNTNEDQDDNDDDDDIVDNSAAVLYQQHVSRDADYVIHFIDKANPQLKNQLLGGNFIPGQYNSNPPHPMVIYIRALISSNKNSSVVARLLRKLEDSTGIEYATKYHCCALFLESMQDRGVLFEDGWNDNNAQGGEATLANVTLGPIGRTCALEYMRNVILVAKENLLPCYHPIQNVNCYVSRILYAGLYSNFVYLDRTLIKKHWILPIRCRMQNDFLDWRM